MRTGSVVPRDPRHRTAAFHDVVITSRDDRHRTGWTAAILKLGLGRMCFRLSHNQSSRSCNLIIVLQLEPKFLIANFINNLKDGLPVWF